MPSSTGAHTKAKSPFGPCLQQVLCKPSHQTLVGQRAWEWATKAGLGGERGWLGLGKQRHQTDVLASRRKMLHISRGKSNP